MKHRLYPEHSPLMVFATSLAVGLPTYAAVLVIIHVEEARPGHLPSTDPGHILSHLLTDNWLSLVLWLSVVIVVATWGHRVAETWRKQSVLFSRTLETVADGIYVVDPSGKITLANSAAERIMRLPRDEITRRSYHDAAWNATTVEGQPFPDADQPFVRVMQTREPVYGVEQVLHHADGTSITISINAAPLCNSRGEVIGEVGAFQDISERKQIEADRARQAATLREQAELLDLTRDSIFVRDLDSRVTFLNHGAEETYGWKKAEAIGKSMQELLQTQFPQPLPAIETELMQTGHWEGELVHTTRDGRRLVVASRWALQRDRQGQPTAVLETNTDITLRREAEDALRTSLLTNQALLNAIPDTMLRLSAEGRILDFKPGKEPGLGLLPGDWTGKHLHEVLPSDLAAQAVAGIERALETRQVQVLEYGLQERGMLRDYESRAILSGQDQVLAIIRDITERKAADRLKHEFISTVSHELRTPLTSIRGAMGLIAGGAVGPIPEQAKVLVDIACKNSERLVRLINDILDMERIESGKMVFRFQPLRLESVVKQAIEDNRAYGEELGVPFVLTRSLPDIKVNGDSDRLIQVMTNLLSNAAKFSTRGDTVEVSVSPRGALVRVAVRDHGPGIPESFRDRVFSRFSQADTSDRRRQGGTGLGLSICQAIVEKHGGTIGFETARGRGTTFYFDLPINDPGDLSPCAPVTETAKARVLVCEDDADVARLLRMMLAQCGFASDIASDAEHAKKLLAEHHYDGMTLDLLLPGQDGISLIRELRRQERTRGLPIVVVSAKAQEGRAELDGDAFLVIDWIDKPVDQDRLTAAIQRAVAFAPDRPLRILHVEDDTDVLQVVSAVLDGAGQVQQARTLTEAKERLGAGPYDLVILDLALPDGAGLELLPLLHRQPLPIPVVIFSAHDVGKETALQVAATLVKSSTSNERLRETIQSLIKRGDRRSPHLSGDPESVGNPS